MHYKIYGRYTPLDMDTINEWFQQHPDAILVTDKVNEPKKFADKFIDRKRLMMELFTWQAVKEGLDQNLTVMPTYTMLKQIKGNKIDFLVKNHISKITASRKTLASQKIFLQNLKDAHISVYAFDINEEKRWDEQYFICHESQYFYGLYADKVNLGRSIICK